MLAAIALTAAATSQTLSREYIYLDSRVIAIEGPAAGATCQIQGYKVLPNGIMFQWPSATITVNGQPYTGNPYVAVVSGPPFSVTSTVPSGYSVAYSFGGGYVSGTSAPIASCPGGVINLYWQYTPTGGPPAPSGTGSLHSGVSTTAIAGTHEVYAHGVQNANSVSFAAFSWLTPAVGYFSVPITSSFWGTSVDLANHAPGSPAYGRIYVHTYLWNASGGFYLDDGASFSRYLSAVPVNNGGLESGSSSPWALYGGTAGGVTTAAAHTGTRSFSLDSGDEGFYQDVPGLLPGHLYKVGGWVRSSQASGPLELLWVHDATGANIAATSENPTSTTWQYRELEFRATNSGFVRIHAHRRPGSGVVYWDDLSVTTVALQNPGFESGLASWSPFGAVQTGTNPTHLNGRSSVSISGVGGVYQDVFGLKNGAVYNVEGWVRADSTAMATLYVHDTSGGGVQGAAFPAVAGWSRVSLAFTATALQNIRVHVTRDSGASATVYWDDVVIRAQ
jgi:hypothetical protein